MNKLIVAGIFAVTGLAGIAAAAPASAAPLSPVPSCSSTTDINQNVDLIRLQLQGAGYDVDRVEEWNGCVRAYVEDANGGGQHTAYFDPDTLQLITANGPIVRNVEG
jgi:hypothetical protein